MGDYNLSYWDQSDCSKIDTVVVPYDFDIKNVSHASIIENKKATLIDYIITDGSLRINKTYVFDILIKTEQKSQHSILNLTLTKKATVSTKLVLNKTNLDIKMFQKTMRNSDWNFFTQKKT